MLLDAGTGEIVETSENTLKFAFGYGNLVKSMLYDRQFYFSISTYEVKSTKHRVSLFSED